MLADQTRVEDYKNLSFITFPIWKLILLTILTFGLYEIVWFYKYWKTIKETNAEQISPFWRAVFGGISAFWLFPILEKYIQNNNYHMFSGTGLAVIYLLLNMLGNVSNGICILSIFSIIPIILIQTKINIINESNIHNAKQYHWSWKTTLGLIGFWLIFACYVLILSIIEVLKNYN